MIEDIDDIVHHDSWKYAEVEYQCGDDMIVFLANGGKILVPNVSQETWNYYYKNQTDEVLTQIIKTHGYKTL